MTEPMIWLIMLPLIGGMLSFLLPRYARLIGVITAPVLTIVSGWYVWSVWAGDVRTYALGGWDAPLGIALRADGLSALMVGMVGLIGFFVTLYSTDYFSPDDDGDVPETGLRPWLPTERYWPLWLLLWASLNVIFLSRDLFNLYVGLELMTLASVGLVVLERTQVALVAATRYLMAAFLGSMSWLFGVGLLYSATGTLDIDQIASRIDGNTTTAIALALLISGLGLKAALFPLHFWLPRAHGSAPAPVSAVLSGTVSKAAVYLSLRVWFDIYDGLPTVAVEQMVGVLGAAGIILCSVQAIRQERLKLMIAYSTVAQIGYFFLIIPLAGSYGLESGVDPAWRFEAWSGGIYQLLAHAFAKASMFLGAGLIMKTLHHDRVADLTGTATRFPLVYLSFGISGLSLMGLPPSGGFVGKWLLLQSAITSGQWWWVVVILIGGLLTAGYVVIVLSQALTHDPEATHDEARPSPHRRRMEYSLFILAGISLLLGIRATEPLELLEIGSVLPLPESAGGER